MKLTLRALVAVTLLTAATLTAYPSLAQDAGIDFWHETDLRIGMSAREEEARTLDREDDLVVRRSLLRFETAGDVADGRLTIEEGMARFAEMNRSHPSAQRFTRASYVGDTDEIRAGWQLVSHLRVHPHPNAEWTADQASCLLSERN